jgi:hypothetical protein
VMFVVDLDLCILAGSGSGRLLNTYLALFICLFEMFKSSQDLGLLVNFFPYDRTFFLKKKDSYDRTCSAY